MGRAFIVNAFKGLHKFCIFMDFLWVLRIELCSLRRCASISISMLMHLYCTVQVRIEYIDFWLCVIWDNFAGLSEVQNRGDSTPYMVNAAVLRYINDGLNTSLKVWVSWLDDSNRMK